MYYKKFEQSFPQKMWTWIVDAGCLQAFCTCRGCLESAFHKNPSPYTYTPFPKFSAPEKLSFSSHLQQPFHLTMLAWNLNLHLRFRFKLSSRPADILIPLKVVLLPCSHHPHHPIFKISLDFSFIGIIFWLSETSEVPEGFICKNVSLLHSFKLL